MKFNNMINKLFKNLYKIEARQHNMLYVFCFIYYLITMIMPSIILTLNGIDHGYFAMNYYYLFSILLLATVNGFIIFKYLHNKYEIDFLHSLPASREDIFYSKLLFGFNVYILPTILLLVIQYFVLLFLRPNALINQNEIIKMVLCNTLYYLVSFLIISFCFCVSGNSIIAVFSSLVIQLLGYILILIYLLLKANFNPSSDSSNILNSIFGYLSPINTYVKMAEDANVIIPTAILIAYMILFFKICKYSFINRPLEKYNKVFAFDAMSRLFQILISSVFGFLGGELLLIFYDNSLNIFSRLIILVIGNVIITTLVFIVIEIIYNKKLTVSLNKIIDYILSILVPVFIVVLYTYTLTAWYKKRRPSIGLLFY